MSPFYLDSTSQEQSVGALALGSFDGVHKGHLALLEKASEISKIEGSKSGALSFSPSPKLFFSTPENPFLQIYASEQNLDEISSSGIDAVFVKKFDEKCSRMSADEFLNFVFSKVKFGHLVVGFDFKFGKDRSGGSQNLKSWCDLNNVKLCIVQAQEESGEKISSTRIKSLLLEGKVEKASDLLGRPHKYIGKVRADQGLGKKIGFPTLNIALDLNTAIAHGVYVSLLSFREKTYFGLSNIGLRPTVFESASEIVLETHILDAEVVEIASGDLIKVEVKKFIRPEKKFANIEELKSQIASDVLLAQSLADPYKV